MKLATNSTNSAAISETGSIYVWGSTRFGLILSEGTGTSKEYETTPQLLKLGKNYDGKKRATKGLDFQSVALPGKDGDIIKNSEESIEDNKSNLLEDDIDHFELSEYCATAISLGSYHAVALLVEKDIQTDFNPIAAIHEENPDDEFFNDYYSTSKLLDIIKSGIKSTAHKSFEWNK